MKNRLKKIISTTVFLLTVVLPNQSFAISVKINSAESSYKPKTEFYVDVLIDPESSNINGVDGKILVSKNANVVRIEDGGSIIKNWILRPEAKNSIEFSGIVPNGFGGYLNSNKSVGLIFRLVLESKNTGQVNIDINDLFVTLNDGNGTVLNTKNHKTIVNISDSGYSDDYTSLDVEKPEVFYEIIENKDLFDGQKTLIFTVIDSKSGFASAYVKEGGSDFKAIKSPYLLEDQAFKGIILLKVIDNAGNENLVKIKPNIKNYLAGMFVKIVMSLVLLIIVLIIFYAKKTSKKNKSH